MNISLPAPLKNWVEQQVAQRGYSTASEFVRDVLRREQLAAAAKAWVDRRLLEALEVDSTREVDRRMWARIRAEGLALASRRKRK